VPGQGAHQFSSQETAVDWLPIPTNTAGDLRLILGSTFVTHMQTTQEILVWSNTALHSMRYVGAPFVYGISVLSSKATIIGPKAKTVLDDTVYWMSKGAFFRYSGRAGDAALPDLDYVFKDLNYDQSDKVYASTNSLFGEVMWFIPTVGSQEVNRCIIFNSIQNIWYYTSMSRTAWMDRVSSPYPQATIGGYIYQHENGQMDGSTSRPAPLSATSRVPQSRLATARRSSLPARSSRTSRLTTPPPLPRRSPCRSSLRTPRADRSRPPQHQAAMFRE
jgi:hypothetical protein